MQRSYFAMLSMLVVLFVAPAYAQSDGFDVWIAAFKQRAQANEDVSEAVLNEALRDLTEDARVVTLDRKQPENKITLARYLQNTISDRRIARGREIMRQYRIELNQIGKHYGVQPKYLVALWGIESDYGNNMGDFSVVRSLATLAYEGRRAKFFEGELVAALKILESEKMTSDELRGSWAGAMGNCQFMPSTYARYAVDGDGDGKRDIWGTEVDVFASIANYLHALNWDADVGVIQPGELLDTGNFKPSEASLERGHSADYWGKRGFEFVIQNGQASRISPSGSQTYYAIYLSKEHEANNDVSLVSENFKALLNWNRSRYFATAVGTLADAIEE